ncbi:MAG TPA: AAA family ATPase [Bradyrhizobium sp.]|nr:AAA family ATPase [Bradyrhizobium sp.]
MSDEQLPPPPPDPFWLPFDEAQMRPTRLAIVGGTDPRELLFREARLPDPATIPPRPWLYGTQLLRGFVSVLVAPGGVGKTAYAMGVALALACDAQIFGERVFVRCNAAVVNLEDPLDELERRLAALMIHHKLTRDHIEGRYFLYSADDRRVTIATLSEDGSEVVHPDEASIIREITAHSIGLLVIDPFAESHSLDENSNPQMIRAAAAWRRIARVTGCAILLIHHVRKGIVTDIDSSRGAKALTDSARVGLIMAPMTTDEAQEFGVDPRDRTGFVRLDDAKANMSKRAGVARWFQLKTIELRNGTDDYPNGDRVAAIAPWTPPSVMGDLTITQCNQALDAIEAGPGAGSRYTRHGSAEGGTRWGPQVLMNLFDMDRHRASGIVTTWVKAGVLREEKYIEPTTRKSVNGLYLVHSKRPGNEVSAP